MKNPTRTKPREESTSIPTSDELKEIQPLRESTTTEHSEKKYWIGLSIGFAIVGWLYWTRETSKPIRPIEAKLEPVISSKPEPKPEPSEGYKRKF